MKTIMQSSKTIALALIIGLGVAYAMAWTGPTQAPPGANVPGPINKGSGTQVISNDITLKGNSGTEIFNFNNLGAVVGGLFETHSNTYLATIPGAKVGIGTANPTALLDVGYVPLQYQYQGGKVGLLTPRCDCDTSLSKDCPNLSFPTTDAVGSVCYDQDTSSGSYKFSYKYLSVKTNLVKHSLVVTSDGKIGIGMTNPTSALDVNGDMELQDNNYIIMGGSNSWILHTPDDGRTDFYIAPKVNGAWDWAHEVRIENNGNINVNGNMNVSGNMNVGGLPVAGNDVLSRETRTFIGGLNIPIPDVNNYSGWKLMKSWNFDIQTISTKTIPLNFISKNVCNNGRITYKLKINGGPESTLTLDCNNNVWKSGAFNIKVDPGTLYSGAELYVNGSNVTGGTFDFTKPWAMYLYKGYSF